MCPHAVLVSPSAVDRMVNDIFNGIKYELLLLWLGGIALVVKDMYNQAVVFLRVAHNDIVCQCLFL